MNINNIEYISENLSRQQSADAFESIDKLLSNDSANSPLNGGLSKYVSLDYINGRWIICVNPMKEDESFDNELSKIYYDNLMINVPMNVALHCVFLLLNNGLGYNNFLLNTDSAVMWIKNVADKYNPQNTKFDTKAWGRGGIDLLNFANKDKNYLAYCLFGFIYDHICKLKTDYTIIITK